MKKFFSLFVVMLVIAMAVAALDFSQVDETYDKEINDQQVYDTLQGMLGQATTDGEKAEVLWRLARVCVRLGDALDEKDKTGKFAIYEEGENYAQQSIELVPGPEAYLWKSGNVGRWGQTKGVMDSLSKAKPMMADLKEVTDTFGRVDSSETWYTLAVLYHSLPGMFGGDNNAAISYARVACDTIPTKYIYGGTYKALAEYLYERNWNANKRAKEIEKMKASWNKETSSNYEKYKYYEGANGADASPKWANGKLSDMSDRQEALIILKYAQLVYESKSFHTATDDRNYQEIADLIKEWS